MFATGNDNRIGKPFANHIDQSARRQPLHRKHHGKADDLGIGGNAGDHFVVRQSVAESVGSAFKRLINTKRFAGAIDHGDFVGRFFQHGRQIG